MIDSLMDKKMTQEFDRVAREKAKVCQKEQKAVEHFLHLEDNLEFDDIMTLDKLYKSNYKEFKNKEVTR